MLYKTTLARINLKLYAIKIAILRQNIIFTSIAIQII
jgi:hypothetical protein